MEKAMSWQQEIDFQCSFGLWPFRRSLEISPKGFLWCGELFPLNTITRLRWGIEQKRGGLLPKRICTATFGTNDREFTVRTKQKDFYGHLTDRYWKAVGRRLLTEMVDGLRAGKRYNFSDYAAVEDSGLYKIDKKLVGGAAEKFYPWEALEWGVVNGNLCFAPKEEPENLLVGLSFLWVDNVHMLNVALAPLLSAEKRTKISSLALE